jgi:hypothetical protein
MKQLVPLIIGIRILNYTFMTLEICSSDDRCQESFNSDQRFSPSTQKSDILYSSNIPELDPPKCVVCMVRINKKLNKIIDLFII